MDIALTREVSPEIARCELSYLEREPIDYLRAAAQHDDYCRRLEALGLEVIRLPADTLLPDCCFVEDAAVVVDELAVITMPGVPARRGETEAIEQALAPHRRISRIALPATLDGGDVLRMGRTFFVGQTRRTNAAGIEALRSVFGPLGFHVVPVRVDGCLHLKSAVTRVDDETVVANPGWFDATPLSRFDMIRVAPEEPGGANVLEVRGQLWAHIGFPRTIDRLDARGFRVTGLDISEFVKAEAALTCKSLLFRRV